MIYFVDEDFGQTRHYRSELIARGHQVTPILTADEAFEILTGADDIQLAIIDVMLAVSDHESERFSRNRTEDYLQTGIVLLEELCASNPEAFPSRAVLLTNTVRQSVLAHAQRVRQVLNVPLLRKNEMSTAFEFGEELEPHLQGHRR